MEKAVTERAELQVRSAFPEGAIARVQVLQHGDDPEVEPGQAALRVFFDWPGRSDSKKADPKTVHAFVVANSAALDVLSAPQQAYLMTEVDVDRWREQFQAPEAAELDGDEIPGPPAGWPGWPEWAADRWPSRDAPAVCIETLNLVRLRIDSNEDDRCRLDPVPVLLTSLLADLPGMGYEPKADPDGDAYRP
jgi:hypothetical protein